MKKNEREELINELDRAFKRQLSAREKNEPKEPVNELDRAFIEPFKNMSEEGKRDLLWLVLALVFAIGVVPAVGHWWLEREKKAAIRRLEERNRGGLGNWGRTPPEPFPTDRAIWPSDGSYDM